MKTKRILSLIPLLLAIALVFRPSALLAQGTAFTYQGSLNNNGTPANGIYDVAFTVYGASTGGSAIAGPITNSPTGITNGLFTVTLDFGSAPFGGNQRWLEIAVRTNGGGAFSTLSPRQQLTPTPYAIFATSASNLTGTVSSSQVSGTYSNPVNFNNGANIFDGTFYGQFFGSTFIGGNFVGNFIGSGSGLSDVWHTSGNYGTTPANFLGTADNQPLTLKVNGQHALHFEPTWDSPNVVGGWSGNYVQPGLPGVMIGGGGSQYFWAGQPQPNVVTNNGQFGVIAGGYNNVVSNYGGAILGGSVHLNGGSFGVIGGGQFHTNYGDYAFMGGGEHNVIDHGANFSVISGGHDNVNMADVSTIAGGYFNAIGSNSYGASVLGGYHNSIRTNSPASSIAAGYNNLIDSYALSCSIAGGIQNTIEGKPSYYPNTAVSAAIGGGGANTIQAESQYSTIGGGLYNIIHTNSAYSTIGGGVYNEIQTNGPYGTIAGGYLNIVMSNSQIGTISGGYSNVVGYGGTVPGGRENEATGTNSFAAGRRAHATNTGSFVLADSSGTPVYSTADNQLTARFNGGIDLQTGGAGLTLDGQPVLAGTSSSFWNTTGNVGTTAGPNFIGTADNRPLLIKGSFVGVGRTTTIGSGETFGVSGTPAIGGWAGMYINATAVASKPYYGYAITNTGIVYHYVDGADTNKWKLFNGGADRLTVAANGFVGIGTTTPDATLSVNGTASKTGGGSWAVFSDARLKTNVQPLEGALDRLMQLQGVTFEYKDPGAIHESPGTQVGMIAQEVEKIFPDWVDTAPNGMKRLSIHGFEALTVEALRDLRKENDSRLAALETTNANIRKENAKLLEELAAQKQATALLESRLEALEKTLTRIATASEDKRLSSAR